MKGKLGRLMFRKIGGRIIPIRISNIADDVATASVKTDKYRQIVAKLPSGEKIAKMNLQIPRKGKTATILSVNVEPKFTKKGIAKNLFARATAFLERAGYKFVRSDDLQHPAQAKIRSAYGRYKAGSKGKNRTKFVADQFGQWGEGKKLVKKDSVLAILKDNFLGRQITATTMLKKRVKK